MNPDRQRIERLLADMKPGSRPQAAAEFWADFEARARLRYQHAPVGRAFPLFTGWRVAAACATVLLVLTGVLVFRPTQTERSSTILSLKVSAPHSAVLIMNEESSDSTILWVAGMETDRQAGDNI